MALPFCKFSIAVKLTFLLLVFYTSVFITIVLSIQFHYLPNNQNKYFKNSYNLFSIRKSLVNIFLFNFKHYIIQP